MRPCSETRQGPTRICRKSWRLSLPRNAGTKTEGSSPQRLVLNFDQFADSFFGVAQLLV
jgi:hypothetical protein